MKTNNKNSNLPKNKSIWVIFNEKSKGYALWFESRKEAKEFKNKYKNDPYYSYGPPMKFCRDY